MDQKEIGLIYHRETDSYTVYGTNDSRDVKHFMLEHGFIDADVLHDEWFVRDLHVYRLELHWAPKIKQYGYCTVEFVGFPYHVISKKEQTDEQYWFIKHLFND